jgi:hypothetical protein
VNARRATIRGRSGALLVALSVAACGGAEQDAAPSGAAADALDSAGGREAPAAAVLGPADGRDLAGTDLGRIAVGEVAPDFTLATYRGDTLTLSENRGAREILLVFYRGAW